MGVFLYDMPKKNSYNSLFKKLYGVGGGVADGVGSGDCDGVCVGGGVRVSTGVGNGYVEEK